MRTLRLDFSGNSLVKPSVSGSSLTLTANQNGPGTNYPSTWGASTNQPGTFSQPSFSVSVANLTGGKNAGTAPGPIYNYSVAYAPNGDVLSGNDTANGNWTYAYDAFNRLLTAASSNTGLGCSWVYDRFGNRLQQNTYQGSCGEPQYTSSGGNNRMDGYSYDLAGNLQNDGNHGYAYDAENRVTSVDTGSTATYVYDAAGRRVRKTSAAGTVDYIYDLAGHEVAEVSSAGALNRGEVYAGGRHLATYDGGTTYFNHVDWLGTERARSNVSGMQCEAVVSLPFGDGQTPKSVNIPCTPTDPSPMHFTGKQRDTETNNDYFGVRYFGSNMGRFLTPDLHAPSLTNPQSWNKYAYAFNNPLRLIDPNGSFPTDAHILWTTAALNQLGFSNAAAFASTVNKVVDIDHFLENELHAMSGAQAYQGFRYGLLSIATNPCSGVGCSGAGESAVALVLGLHLVQDRQAHEGIESLLDHFFRYGFGDADPNSEAGKKAQDETQKFLADFKHLLVANLGEEGAADALLKMQAAAAQLTGNGVKQYVTQIYKELTVNVPTQDPQEGPIWFKSQAQQEAQRQCELGNQAACGN